MADPSASDPYPETSAAEDPATLILRLRAEREGKGLPAPARRCLRWRALAAGASLLTVWLAWAATLRGPIGVGVADVAHAGDGGAVTVRGGASPRMTQDVLPAARGSGPPSRHPTRTDAPGVVTREPLVRRGARPDSIALRREAVRLRLAVADQGSRRRALRMRQLDAHEAANRVALELELKEWFESEIGRLTIQVARDLRSTSGTP